MSRIPSFPTTSAGKRSGENQPTVESGKLSSSQQWLLGLLALLVAGATLASTIIGQPTKSGPFGVAGLVLTTLIASLAVVGRVPERIRVAGFEFRLHRLMTQDVVQGEISEDSRDTSTRSGTSAVSTPAGREEEDWALGLLVAAIEAGEITSAQKILVEWARLRAKRAASAVREGDEESAVEQLSGLVADPDEVVRREPRGRRFEEEVGTLLSALSAGLDSLRVQPTDHRGGFRWDFLLETPAGASTKVLAVEARLDHRFLDRLTERLESDPRVEGLIVVSASFQEADIQVRPHKREEKSIVICRAELDQIRKAVRTLVRTGVFDS